MSRLTVFSAQACVVVFGTSVYMFNPLLFDKRLEVLCPQLLKLVLDDSHMNLRKNGEYLIDRSLLPSNPMTGYRVPGSKVHMVLTGVKCTAAKVVAHER